MNSSTRFALALVFFAFTGPGQAPASTVFQDISPDFSDTDPQDPDGATGGRVNGIVIQPGDHDILYAASEWGGIYKSIDAGLTWNGLDGHRPRATWDVAIDPVATNRIYATSFYDGRATPLSGINVSNDGGATWTRPVTASPPPGFCSIGADRTEPSAFGIAIDPVSPANVFVGTSCGLAVSGDSGTTWSYRDPTSPVGSATRIWDVVALGGGVVHVCGDDGHLRSDDGGTTWVAGSGLPSGRCSLAVSPDESYVLIAVVGTTIYETTDGADPGGATWAQTRSNPSPQGRIPFVATNQRSDVGPDDVFDLWFGDVRLYRVGCTSGTAPGGSPRCGTGASPAWLGPFTRSAGAHDDCGDIAFDSEVAVDACPVLMSSDGGVYYNTDTTTDCHNPNWEQPEVTPHGLWPFTMSGFQRSGGTAEDLYFGNQDNGLFGTTDAGTGLPTWHNPVCCDGFDTAGDAAGGLYSICCFGGGRATRVYRTAPGFASPSELADYPPTGLLDGFNFPDNVVHVEGSSYAMITEDCTQGAGGCPGADGGLYFTSNIDANPITWTQLGNATEPPTNNVCGLYVGLDSGVPTFYVQSGSCNSTGTNDRLFRFVGTSPFGTWTELFLPTGGFGVVAVDGSEPERLIASGLTSADAALFSSTDGGTSWSPMPALDELMEGSGAFPMKNTRGPTNFTGFNGYWQPSMVAFDPASEAVVAGGQDSGVFLSRDDGVSWELLTDPYDSHSSGVPHIPRPRYGRFDTGEPGEPWKVYIGSQGRGIWRFEIPPGIFSDGFESGDTSRWSSTVP